MRTILIFIWLSFIGLNAYCQINVGGKPYSFKNEIKAKKIERNENLRIELPKLDFDKILEEDKLSDHAGKPYRYGKAVKVDYNWKNSGEWMELENGDRIWKLEIYCPSAKSINLTYDKFWLPEGGILYLYDKDKKSVIGGFNNRNNRGTKENPSKYATDLIFSDDITLEYYEPKEVRDEGIISISNIIYGYADINSLLIDPCTVNINCSPEGDNWQDEKKSVALFFVLSGGYNYALGTGSLMNNTRGDGTPYFLTANHIIAAANRDAISNPDASEFLFWWNYECADCNYCSTPPHYSTVGATIVANNSATDFALLKLIESPYDLSPQIQAYYNGWDRQTPLGGTICIHHPLTLPKKISEAGQPQSGGSGGNFWKVTFQPTYNGNSILYEGSSGAPLFSINNGRVIGQQWATANYNCENQSSYFGKFGVSWNNGTDARRRLKDWLDPDNTGANYLDGTYCTGTRYIANTNFDVDTVIYACTINMQNVMVRNGANVTFNAANDVVISETFEVTIGSTIEVK